MSDIMCKLGLSIAVASIVTIDWTLFICGCIMVFLSILLRGDR